MKTSIVAAVAAVALLAAVPRSAQAGENDLGLKASGNGPGPGGVYKGRAETTGAGQSLEAAKDADTRASKNPNSNNQDTGRVDTPTGTAVKPPQVLPPNQQQ